MSRFFRYILVTDNGTAPSIDEKLLSLATCKPAIRRSAKPGDWVAGFMPRPFERGLVVYAGRVARKFEWTDYAQIYPGRRDAVYAMDAAGGFTRLNPSYHAAPGLMEKDLSGPVLVFEKKSCWYFGCAPVALPAELGHVAPSGKGHRVNGAKPADIVAFEGWLREGWEPGAHAPPRHLP